ncbi:MAG TPA: hypothetical protein VN764_08080 [Polyangiaceae bacterium]|nr:hypothetical protein [Polyangiaceae bacterium]
MSETTRYKTMAWRLLVLSAVLALAGAVTYVVRGRAPSGKVTIPRALPASASASNKSDTTAATESPTPSCVIPRLPEGVKSKDIRAQSQANLSFLGGIVENGKYRVVDTFALTQEFTPGRWTLALDLSDNHQGAYYRPTGLTSRSSRIRWSTHGNQLQWETLCPDPGERMSFEFTVVGARLYLLTREKIVVVLEPYADSEVSRLAPLSDP